jgi:ankyrin repeat protein
VNRNFELAEFLIKEGADINLAKETKYNGERILLRVVVKKGDIELIKLLLDKGAEVNALSYRRERQCEYHLATPLQVIIASRDIKLATLLLRSGTNINAPGYEISTLY